MKLRILAAVPKSTDGILDQETAKSWLERIKSEVDAPVVQGYVSTLGGESRPSILLSISTEPKSKWSRGILENSRYVKIHVDYQGNLEVVSCYPRLKFRRANMKTCDSLIAKINTIVQFIK